MKITSIESGVSIYVNVDCKDGNSFRIFCLVNHAKQKVYLPTKDGQLPPGMQIYLSETEGGIEEFTRQVLEETKITVPFISHQMSPEVFAGIKKSVDKHRKHTAETEEKQNAFRTD